MKKTTKREVGHLFFSKKIPDLDGLAGVGNIGIDGEMSINEPHLVTVTLGDTGDEILDVAEGGADGDRGLPGAEPSVDLQLSLPNFPVAAPEIYFRVFLNKNKLYDLIKRKICILTTTTIKK